MQFSNVSAQENEASVINTSEYSNTDSERERLKRTPGDHTHASSSNRNFTYSKTLLHQQHDPKKWFENRDSKHECKITAKELQQAFETFQNRHFSESSCKFVVRLFDLDQNGGLDVKEFEQLFLYIKGWVNAFNACDKERCKFLTEKGLESAFKLMDINFSSEFVKFLIQKNGSNRKTMSLDQFIVTCIQLERHTEEFKKRDEKCAGAITVRYEDFLEMILRSM